MTDALRPAVRELGTNAARTMRGQFRYVDFDSRAPIARALPLALTVAAGLIALWSHIAVIDHSLWSDELETIGNYINGGLTAPFAHYNTNDHILFGVLTSASTSALGDHSDAAYRLWDVFPALAAGAILTWWAWRRLDRWVAALFAVFLSCSPLYYFLGTEARGYGLTFLASSLLVVCADWLLNTESRRAMAAFSISALLGIWTLPIFVLEVAGVAAAVWLRRSVRRPLVAALVTVGAGTLIFYAPVLGGIASFTGQHFGEQLPWYGLVSRPLSDLADPSMTLILPSATAALREACVGVAVVIGFALLWRRRERVLASVLLLPVVLTYGVLEVGRFYVSVRFSSFLLMPLLMLVAVAVAGVGTYSSRIRLPLAVPLPGVTVLALATALCAVVLLKYDRFFEQGRDVPFENYKEAAALIKSTNAPVITNSRRTGGFEYYLPRNRWPSHLSSAALQSAFCTRPGPFIYLEHGLYSIAPPVTCLVERGATPVSVPQVRAWIRVWFVAGPPPRGGTMTYIASVPGGTPPVPSEYQSLIETIAH